MRANVYMCAHDYAYTGANLLTSYGGTVVTIVDLAHKHISTHNTNNLWAFTTVYDASVKQIRVLAVVYPGVLILSH